jgi:hypothetical protein
MQIPFIRAFQQDAVKIDKDIFVTVNVISTGANGWEEVIYQPKDPDSLAVRDMVEAISNQENFIVSFNFFSVTGNIKLQNITDLSLAFKKYLHSSEACLFLQQRHIGLGAISNIRDVTAVENAQFEARTQMDVDINVAVTDLYDTLEIEDIDIQGEYEQSGEITQSSVQINYSGV